MPSTWRHLPDSDAEWILASSHLFAHHARFSGPARDARKFVYTHTPARYIWTPELDMRGDNRVVRAASRPLQNLDRTRAKEAYSIAANSRFVSERIERTWGRDSVVIYPPVSVERHTRSSEDALSAEDQSTLAALPDTFVLGASRFVPYKRLDVAIDTGVANGTAVVLAGEGPDEPRLRALAAQHPGVVTFITKPSTALLNQLYRRALALVFPAIEDFGIMPVEAMATGTPVIASTVGGVAESVIHGRTGALTESFDAGSLRDALSIATATDAAACVARAWEFDVSVFDDKIRGWIGESAR